MFFNLVSLRNLFVENNNNNNYNNNNNNNNTSQNLHDKVAHVEKVNTEKSLLIEWNAKHSLKLKSYLIKLVEMQTNVYY